MTSQLISPLYIQSNVLVNFQVNPINLGEVSWHLTQKKVTQLVCFRVVPDDADGHVVGAGDDVAGLGGEGDTANEWLR